MSPEDLGRGLADLFERGAAEVTMDEVRRRATGRMVNPTRSRPPVAIAAFAAVIIGGLIIGLLTQPADPVSTSVPAAASSTTSVPDSTTTPTLEQVPSVDVFVPPTRSQDGMTHVALTMLDGSHIRLAYPDDLDLTSSGIEVQSVGHIGGDHERLIGVHYGTPESWVDRFEDIHGDSDVTALYEVDGWPSVEYREFSEISYLVYDFMPWTVYVWDRAGALFTDEARETWAESLFGQTYGPGFLVLRAAPPLELVPAADSSGPDGPDVTISGSSASLLIFSDDCDRMTRLGEEEYGAEVFAFCDEATNTLFFVGGDARTQQRVHETLVVDPPVGDADGDPPSLDQQTNSHVYFSTDTHLTAIDVDSGLVEVTEMPALAPGDPPFRLAWREDALVFYGETENGGATMAVDPGDIDSPWVIKEGTFFIPSGVDDRVWTFASAPNSNAFEMQEFSVDGEAVSDASLTPESWPIGAVEDGVLFETGEGTLGVWDPVSQSFVREISASPSGAALGNRIVTCGVCDDELALIDLDDGTERALALPIEVVDVHPSVGVFSRDGRHVALPAYLTSAPFSSDTESVVLLVDLELGEASIIPGTHTHTRFPHSAMAWSESGWLFIGPIGLQEVGSEMLAYRPGEDVAYRVGVESDGVYYGMAAR